MFSPGHSGANAYARVGVETGVMGASPHRLIVMLYQGARQAIAQARMHVQQGNVSARGEAIGKARLQAFPRATLCVTCKQREERR